MARYLRDQVRSRFNRSPIASTGLMLTQKTEDLLGHSGLILVTGSCVLKIKMLFLAFTPGRLNRPGFRLESCRITQELDLTVFTQIIC